MTTNPTAPCARPGCGAPLAWHTKSSTVDELNQWPFYERGNKHARVYPGAFEGWCISDGCSCSAYIAPEPPQPERTAYVVEMTADERDLVEAMPVRSVPLADYLASHPQAVPGRKCIISDCPNTADQGRFVGDLCAPCSEYLSQWGRWQLMAGPQLTAAPALCICGGRKEEHGEDGDGDGRCYHQPRYWRQSGNSPTDGYLTAAECDCPKFEAVQG